jgi:L-alanine-DL-glutamate epimerase-like enolase superfamily enzyme
MATDSMKVSFKIHNLAFRYPFTISKGTKTHQPTFIVELEHFGFKGYGEAPAITYYNIPVEKMQADLEQKKQFVEKFAFSDPERYWHYLHHLFPMNPFLVCALDMAGWDIYGKIKRKQLHELWGLDTAAAPLTDFTIGIDSVEMMVKKCRKSHGLFTR